LRLDRVQALARLRARRISDTVARYAGDEFTLILRHIVQRDDVLRIADKIVACWKPRSRSAMAASCTSRRIGISFYPDDATTAEKLLKHADIAMYNAKGMGRNNFQAYVAVPEESHQQRLSLEAKLRVAERNNELRVLLPAAGRCPDRGHHRHGGADPLGAPGARHDQSGVLHSVGRGQPA
jgi:predicted signal transduction protein with EAL and GGDEF domain